MGSCHFDTWQNLEASLFLNPGNANSNRLPNGFPHPSSCNLANPCTCASVCLSSRSFSVFLYCRPGVRDVGTASIRRLVVILCRQQMPKKLPIMHTHPSTQTSNTCKNPIEHQILGKEWLIKGKAVLLYYSIKFCPRSSQLTREVMMSCLWTNHYFELEWFIR